MSDNALSSPVPQKFDEKERTKLERLFRAALAYLAVLISGSLILSIYFLRQSPQDLLLVALFTGVIGSATAAFVSALDRHAQGLEDRYGGATPVPDAKKERFSERMFYWFLGRPWLGAVVGVAVFWGKLGGDLGTGPQVAFRSLLAGLFAKLMLDVLRKLSKSVFRQ